MSEPMAHGGTKRVPTRRTIVKSDYYYFRTLWEANAFLSREIFDAKIDIYSVGYRWCVSVGHYAPYGDNEIVTTN